MGGPIGWGSASGLKAFLNTQVGLSDRRSPNLGGAEHLFRSREGATLKRDSPEEVDYNPCPGPMTGKMRRN